MRMARWWTVRVLVGLQVSGYGHSWRSRPRTISDSRIPVGESWPAQPPVPGGSRFQMLPGGAPLEPPWYDRTL